MEKLKVLDSAAYKEVSRFFENIGVELDETGMIANANLCFIVSDYCKGKITAAQILRAYDYVTDVLQGKQPRIVVSVPKAERVIWAKKLLLSQGFSSLTSDELDFFSFCIVYSFFVYGLNEETGEMEPAIYEFTAKDRIVKEYKHCKDSGLWKFEQISYSDPSKDNYGLSVDNPIEVMSVGLEYEYLNGLVTVDGRPITYDRIGAFRGKYDLIVDGYNIYTEGFWGKKKLTTLYITGYGSKNSYDLPKGFKVIGR